MKLSESGPVLRDLGLCYTTSHWPLHSKQLSFLVSCTSLILWKTLQQRAQLTQIIWVYSDFWYFSDLWLLWQMGTESPFWALCKCHNKQYTLLDCFCSHPNSTSSMLSYTRSFGLVWTQIFKISLWYHSDIYLGKISAAEAFALHCNEVTLSKQIAAALRGAYFVQSISINVMVRVSRFVRNSQLCH